MIVVKSHSIDPLLHKEARQASQLHIADLNMHHLRGHLEFLPKNEEDK